MAVLSLMFVFAACSKYPEGSKFTILTKKARLVNTWKLDLITITSGGYTQTSTADVTLDIKKDETYTSTWTSGSSSITEEGTWKFSSDKLQVIFTDSDGNVTTNTIVKLKNKELSFEDTENNITTRLDYVAK